MRAIALTHHSGTAGKGPCPYPASWCRGFRDGDLSGAAGSMSPTVLGLGRVWTCGGRRAQNRRFHWHRVSSPSHSGPAAVPWPCLSQGFPQGVPEGYVACVRLFYGRFQSMQSPVELLCSTGSETTRPGCVALVSVAVVCARGSLQAESGRAAGGCSEDQAVASWLSRPLCSLLDSVAEPHPVSVVVPS